MINRTINDEIIDIVIHEIDKIAFPSECKITKIYNDSHVDIESDAYGSIYYVKVYGTYELGDNGLLLFLNNDITKPVVIT